MDMKGAPNIAGAIGRAMKGYADANSNYIKNKQAFQTENIRKNTPDEPPAEEPEKDEGKPSVEPETPVEKVMASQPTRPPAGNYAPPLEPEPSDERIKEKTGTGEGIDLVAQVAQKINNYLYHYKPGAGEDPTEEYSGPMAQELLGVPGYQSAVFEDDNGYLRIDTSRLALVNAGVIADLSKRLMMLEQFIGEFMQEISGQQGEVE